MIISAREANLGIQIICPHCKFGSRYDASFLEDAIKDNSGVVCVACEKKFHVVAVVLERAAQLQRAADASAATVACEHDWIASANIGELCKCSKCGKVTPLPQTAGRA